MQRARQLGFCFALAVLLVTTVRASTADPEFAKVLQAGTEESVRGDLVHAAADLQKAVSLEPQNAAGWFQLGLLYSKTASFRNAETAFRRAVSLNPHYPPAHFWLGWTLIIDPQSKVDWAGAVAECRTALVDEPDNPDALNLLGIGLTNLGQLDEAVDVLKRATAIKPPSAPAHFNLAIALEKSGHAEQARSEYEAAIEARSDYPQASSALGKLLLSMGQPAEAEQVLLRALRLNPDLADAHYALARAMQSLKKNAEAQIEFDQVGNLARLQPDGIESMQLSNASLSSASRGDFASAIASLRRAIALKPDYGVPHYNLGLILADTGDMTGAVRELIVAISLLPGQAKPWFDLGRVFERQGDSNKALEAFEWAARLEPADTTMQTRFRSSQKAASPRQAPAQGQLPVPGDTAKDHISAGVELLHERQPLDAIGELLRGLTLEPADMDARRNLATAYESLGNFDQALLEYHKLLLLSPQDAAAHLALGKILLKQGHAEQAASQFRAALAYQPQSPEARASLADALRASAAH